jgi:hypothetical protein
MQTARRPDWKRLLERECASSPQLLRYATDPREGDCLRLLPALRRGRALFLGNALAILPTILAEQFESVVVADSNSRRLALAAQRTDEQAIGNLACVPVAAAEDISARLGKFDLLVVGEERPDTPAWLPFEDWDAPRRLARATAPDGWLMYDVRFRRSDALAYTVARPLRRGAPMFYPDHARMLAAAGFTLVRGYGRSPDHRPYQFYIPLHDQAIMAYWIRRSHSSRGLRRRLAHAAKNALHGFGASGLLFNNFLIAARRGA